MKSKDYQQCLKLANECASMRNYIDHIKYHGDVHSDEFYYVCRHLNYLREVNSKLVAHYSKGKARFVAKLNQAISRAPKIRFWG